MAARHSCVDTSTCSPRPVARRAKRAPSEPTAASRPAWKPDWSPNALSGGGAGGGGAARGGPRAPPPPGGEAGAPGPPGRPRGAQGGARGHTPRGGRGEGGGGRECPAAGGGPPRRGGGRGPLEERRGGHELGGGVPLPRPVLVHAPVPADALEHVHPLLVVGDADRDALARRHR